MFKKFLLSITLFLILVAASGSSQALAITTFNSINQNEGLADAQSDYYFQLSKKLHPGGGATLIGRNSVVVNQNELFVGNSNTGGGKLYIFHRNQGGVENWGLFKSLSNTLDVNDYYFGSVAAFDGDTLVVGSYGYDDFHGAILIFERDWGGPNNWGLVKATDGRTLSGDPAFYGSLGKSVAISGDTIVAGATFDYATGGVHIFERNQGGTDNWGQTLLINDPYPGSPYTAFGEVVVIDSDTLIISADRENVGGFSQTGAVYVLERNQGGVGNWGQVGKLTGYLNDGVHFGASLALDGDTLVIGEPGFSYSSNPSFGAALVFRRDLSNPNHWEEVIRLFDPEGWLWTLSGLFGASLDIEGDMIVVGGPGDSSVSTPPSGAVVVFERNEGGLENWGYTARIADPGGNTKDYFGSQVSISDQTLAIGVQGDDDFGSATGAVHIYEKQILFKIFLPIVIR